MSHGISLMIFSSIAVSLMLGCETSKTRDIAGGASVSEEPRDTLKLAVPGTVDLQRNAQSESRKGVNQIAEPTGEQIQATKAAIENLGGRISDKVDPETRQRVFQISLPPTANDELMKRLPNVPFAFILSLEGFEVGNDGPEGTKVTDAGLKELAGQKNLSGLNLHGDNVTDASLKELAVLKTLSALSLDKTNVTDEGMKELAEQNQLSRLRLHRARVSNAGLRELAGLENLSSLTLINTWVTDAGLKELSGLKKLSFLNLSFSNVTDAGLKELAGLENLSSLDLAVTKVTDGGVQELQKALPRCQISR